MLPEQDLLQRHGMGLHPGHHFPHRIESQVHQSGRRTANQNDMALQLTGGDLALKHLRRRSVNAPAGSRCNATRLRLAHWWVP